MSSQQIESHRENVKVFTEDVVCKLQLLELLQKIYMLKCFLPLDDIVEVGHNETTGFVWLKQKKSKM
ncbi:hypothetical protein ACS0TY_004102 [Phlomoides rotata]